MYTPKQRQQKQHAKSSVLLADKKQVWRKLRKNDSGGKVPSTLLVSFCSDYPSRLNGWPPIYPSLMDRSYTGHSTNGVGSSESALNSKQNSGCNRTASFQIYVTRSTVIHVFDLCSARLPFYAWLRLEEDPIGRQPREEKTLQASEYYSAATTI